VSGEKLIFNPPPGWPKPPDGWKPPAGWKPDPSWPQMPDGWQLWLPAAGGSSTDDDNPSPESEAPSALAGEIERLRSENHALKNQLALEAENRDELVILDDEAVLQSVGIYRYHHPLENAVAFKNRLQDISTAIADLVKSGHAIEMSQTFTFDNSLAKGRKMTADLAKLMLRAYNAEADNSIRSLRLGNVVTAKKRIESSRNSIAKLGRMMEMHISEEFHALRLQEIELTADWLMMKQEEKEAAREEKARLREERRAQQELANERERLDKERAHLANALSAVRESGQTDLELEARLAEIDSAIEQNDYRAANIRAGYVYVISNRGAFGKGVVKIGLTRRLDPVDRVNELSGAAVPFRFDVHCLFFSEDAVSLETELHAHFSDRSLNLVNSRKEFFFATPGEVRAVLESKVGNLLEFTEDCDAHEFLQSVSQWPDARRPEPSTTQDG